MTRLIIRTIIGAAAVAAIAAAAWRLWPRSENEPRGMHAASVKEIRAVARLCSTDIYDEVPLRGSIGTKHMFARMLLQGSISFDLDKLQADVGADTVRVTLPPEIVELRESTAPEAYVVVDTWNTRLLGSSNLTAAEENAIKRKMLDHRIKHVYARGYVRRARAEAARNLAQMLRAVYGRPVKVIDPTPAGVYGGK